MTFPGAGNDVGNAYIRILADGSNLDESIRREFGKHDKTFAKMGDDNGATYQKRLGERLDKGYGINLAKLDRSFQKQRARYNAEGSILADTLNKSFAKSLRKHLGDDNGDITNRIIRNLNDQFNAGQLDIKGIKEQLKSNTGLLRLRHQATVQILAEEKNRQNALERLRQQVTARLVAEEKARQAALNREAESGGKRLERLLTRRADLLAGVDRQVSDQNLRRIRTDADRVLNEARRGSTRGLHDLEHDLTTFNNKVQAGLVTTTGYFRRGFRVISDGERKFHDLDAAVDRFANSAGKAFGKGSRNNFVNAVGSIVAGATKLTIGLLPSVVKLTGELGGEFRQAWKDGETLGTKLSNIADVGAQNLTQGLGFLLKAAGGLAAGFGGIILIGGPLAALLSALTAGAIALAGAVAFALAGAIGALLPLIAPLIGGILTLTIAFAGFTRAAKRAELAKVFGPVLGAFKQLRAATEHSLFSEFPKQVPLIARLVRQLTPLFGGMGHAIANVGTNFLIATQGKGFQAFLETMKKFLPDAISRLGQIVTDVFTGTAGLFRALSPFATRLLVIIGRLTDDFDNWANSARGQNRIKRFMDQAWVSARKLTTTVKDLFKVTSDLLSAGRGPGNGFLDSINSSLERFDKFLNSPAGKDGLKKFFDRAKTAFGGLGVLLNGIVKLFAALNSDAGQKLLKGLLVGLAKVLSLVAQALPIVLNLAKALGPGIGGAIATILGPLAAFGHFLKGHTTLAKELGIALVSIVVGLKAMKIGFAIGNAATSGLGVIGTKLSALAGAMRLVNVAAGAALAGGVIGATAGGGTGGWLAAIFGGAGAGALLGATAGGVGALVGAIGGGLSGAISHLIALHHQNQNQGPAAFQAVADAARAAGITVTGSLAQQQAAVQQFHDQVDSLATALDNSAGKFAGLARTAVAQNLQQGGAFDALAAIQKAEPNTGLNQADITSAALGNAAALKKVNKELGLAFLNNSALVGPISKINGVLATQNAVLTAATIKYINNIEAQHKNALATRTASEEVHRFGVSLDASTANGLLNTQFLRDHIAVLNEQAQRQLDAGHSAAFVNREWKDGADKLRAQLTALHVNGGLIDQLVASYKNVPATKTTKVTADTSQAGASLLTLQGQLDAIHNRSFFVNLVLKGTGAFKVIANAAGAILNKPTFLPLAGEAGPEAIVPLRRPLSQVDPSVRWLSAIAQGKDGSKFANGGIRNTGKTVNVEAGAIQVNTITQDPHAVAVEVLNTITANGAL